MATINVTVPDTVALGRNGAVGLLQVDWSRVPQPVLDHIASVYFPQYLTDAANAGGRDKGPADRLARAQKKLENMYEGKVRARGDAAEPVDPVEQEAYQIAKAALIKKAKSSPAWSSVPKDMRKKDAGVVHALNLIGVENGEPERSLAEWIEAALESKPEIRKTAERIVREKAKSGGITL
jgi:hypothetical protein